MSHCNALLKNYWLGPFKDEKEMKFVQNSYAKAFFHPKNVYDNPKISWRNYVTLYDTGPLSHCTTISDLFLIFCKSENQMFFLFGTEKYSTMPIQLESCPPTLSTRQSSSRSQEGGCLPLLTMMIWSLMLNKYCNVIRK